MAQEKIHIDDWLDDPSNKINFPIAHQFFEAHRRSASEQIQHPYDGKLFCKWNGKVYRVTGCSRLGDIWLTSNLSQKTGYENRVDISECSDWAEYG